MVKVMERRGENKKKEMKNKITEEIKDKRKRNGKVKANKRKRNKSTQKKKVQGLVVQIDLKLIMRMTTFDATSICYFNVNEN